jgi:hypothetical protein
METTKTENLISKQTAIEALDRAISEGSMKAIRSHWDIYMSPEQQEEFSGSYVKFEFCVRRRYNVMTGGTL